LTERGVALSLFTIAVSKLFRAEAANLPLPPPLIERLKKSSAHMTGA